jgi:hypothetical protein
MNSLHSVDYDEKIVNILIVEVTACSLIILEMLVDYLSTGTKDSADLNIKSNIVSFGTVVFFLLTSIFQVPNSYLYVYSSSELRFIILIFASYYIITTYGKSEINGRAMIPSALLGYMGSLLGIISTKKFVIVNDLNIFLIVSLILQIIPIFTIIIHGVLWILSMRTEAKKDQVFTRENKKCFFWIIIFVVSALAIIICQLFTVIYGIDTRITIEAVFIFYLVSQFLYEIYHNSKESSKRKVR